MKAPARALNRTAAAGWRLAQRIDGLHRKDPTLHPDMVRHVLNGLAESPADHLERALRRGRAIHAIGR